MAAIWRCIMTVYATHHNFFTINTDNIRSVSRSTESYLTEAMLEANVFYRGIRNRVVKRDDECIKIRVVREPFVRVNNRCLAAHNYFLVRA